MDSPSSSITFEYGMQGFKDVQLYSDTLTYDYSMQALCATRHIVTYYPGTTDVATEIVPVVHENNFK